MQKILHINDGDLDDPRIINSAITGKKDGNDIYFCGVFNDSTLPTDVFKQIEWINFPHYARVSSRLIPFIDEYWPFYPYPQYALLMKKQIKKVLDTIRPDIIHAHNIFSAYHCMQFGFPMVLDDHECYSVYVTAKHENESNFISNVRVNIKHKIWAEWEKKISEKYPVITVSKPISDYYNRYTNNVFVLPNYPISSAINVEKLISASDCEIICSAYLGADSVARPPAIRNITGLYELFDNSSSNSRKLIRIGVKWPNHSRIRSYGNIPMDDAYNILKTECHIGLIPWKPHWFHKYCCPNKSFEYAHCGLLPLVSKSLVPVIEDFGKHCETFENYDELRSYLDLYENDKEFLDKKRLEVYRFAKSNLIWEKVEHRVLEAYKHA